MSNARKTKLRKRARESESERALTMLEGYFEPHICSPDAPQTGPTGRAAGWKTGAKIGHRILW